MNFKKLDAFITKLDHVSSDFKIEWEAQRYFIADKMFAMYGKNKQQEQVITLKMEPSQGAFYRENYKGITEGYYMNKIHWISLVLAVVEKDTIKECVEKSHDYFITTLPKKVQASLLSAKL